MKWSSICIVALLGLALAGLALAQTNADSYRKAGAAYFKAGQFQKSVKAYQQVIRLEPNDADAYGQLGEAFTRLKMNKEAAEAFEKQADLLISHNGTSASGPTHAVTQPSQNTTAQAQPQPSAAGGQLKYKVGQRVEYVENGKWYKAIITKVRDDSADHLDGKIYAPYRVHSIGYNDIGDTWVCCADFTDHRSQLRPAGSGPTEPVPGGAAGEAKDVVLKAMRGATTTTPDRSKQAAANGGGGAVPLGEYNCVMYSGGQLINVGGFTLQSGGVYHDEDNGRGTFTYDSNQHQITFQGAAMSGQVGKYDSARGTFTLKSARNSVDCDRSN